MRPSPAGLDHAELVGLGERHPDPGHGDTGTRGDVLLEHLVGIHAVDVVRPEHQDVVRALVADDVEVLEDRIGRAREPLRAPPHLGRHRRDVVVQEARQPPRQGDVKVEAVALVLGQHDDFEQAAIGQVGQGEVDEPVVPGERHGRLGPVQGQRHEPFALPACQDHGQKAGHRINTTGAGPGLAPPVSPQGAKMLTRTVR